MRHVLAPYDLSPAETDAVLRRAAEMKAAKFLADRRNLRVGALFFNNSLRTRVSFEESVWRLGGHIQTMVAGQDTWAIELDPDAVMEGTTVENIVEAAGVLGRYFDVLGVRSFAGSGPWEHERTEPVLSAFCRYAGKPIISLEGATQHPCQSLADALTLREQWSAGAKGRRVTLMWAWHPNPLPTAVPSSFLQQMAREGAQVTVAHPEGYDLDAEVVDEARREAEAAGGSVAVVNDRAAGLAEAEVVYVKSWGRLDLRQDPDSERAGRAGLRDWRLDEAAWSQTNRAKVLHCLPVRRNLKIAGSLLDSPHSLIYDQAENRVWAQTALLEFVLANS